jgi:hypothetical protein
MAEIFTQIFQPASVGNQRRLGLDDHKIFRPAFGCNLQDQACSMNRRPCRFKPRVDYCSRDDHFGTHPGILPSRFKRPDNLALHLSTIVLLIELMHHSSQRLAGQGLFLEKESMEGPGSRGVLVKEHRDVTLS